MSNDRELEPICPVCGSADIKSTEYDYDLAKLFYGCVDCETQGSIEFFEPEKEEDCD